MSATAAANAEQMDNPKSTLIQWLGTAYGYELSPLEMLFVVLAIFIGMYVLAHLVTSRLSDNYMGIYKKMGPKAAIAAVPMVGYILYSNLAPF